MNDFELWESEGYIDSTEPEFWEPSKGCAAAFVLCYLTGTVFLALLIYFATD